MAVSICIPKTTKHYNSDNTSTFLEKVVCTFFEAPLAYKKVDMVLWRKARDWFRFFKSAHPTTQFRMVLSFVWNDSKNDINIGMCSFKSKKMASQENIWIFSPSFFITDETVVELIWLNSSLIPLPITRKTLLDDNSQQIWWRMDNFI